MHLGLAGVLVVVWFVAILFGDEDTRAAAWSLALGALALVIAGALVLGLVLMTRR
jgi:hypothetical protein